MDNGSPENTDTNNKVETVDSIIAEKLVKHDDGSYGGLKEVDGKTVPIKLSEALKDLNITGDKAIAVTAEVRRRGTERSFTKVNKEKLELQAELEVYKSLMPDNLDISAEEQEQLDLLKYKDPDAWFDQMSEIKARSKSKLAEDTAAAVEEAKRKALERDSIEDRVKQLEEFNANTDTPITDEQIANDIPPRLLKQVEAGDITFAEMLDKAHDFINGKKVVNNPSIDTEPSFSNTPGASNPGTPNAKTLEQTYQDIKL